MLLLDAEGSVCQGNRLAEESLAGFPVGKRGLRCRNRPALRSFRRASRLWLFALVPDEFKDPRRHTLKPSEDEEGLS